jgi:hypothetical protein
MQDDLVGSWRTDPSDLRSLKAYGDVSLRFERNGKLTYTVHLKDKDQIIQLTYRVEGNCLMTDQPSAPREERVEFSIAPDGRLVLHNPPPSAPTFYVRA